MQALHIDNSLIIFRNQTSQKLGLPTNQRTLHEGVDVFLLQDIALGEHCNLFRIFFEGAEIFPNGSRRFTEQLAAFFRSEIFEYVFLSAVLTVGIQIEALFAGLLGNFFFQSLQVLAGFYASLDTVEAGQVEGCNGDVGIGVRVRRTHFDTGSFIVVQIADQACKNGSVTGRVIRAQAKAGNDADRSLEAGFQTVQRVNGAGYKRIGYLVVFQKAHESAVADSGQEVLMHILRREQVNDFAVFHFCGNAYMCMLTAACNTGNRFSLEGNLQAVHAENFFNDDTCQKLVIRSLNAAAELPVNLQLLHNVSHMTCAVNLTFNAATFLVAHFRLQAVQLQSLNSLLQCSTHVAAGTLPILLLHYLRRAQSLQRCVLTRSFYPKFQLGSTGEEQLFNLSRIYMLQTGNYRMLSKQIHDFFFYISQSIIQNRTGINMIAVVNQIAGNAQSTDHAAAFCVKMLIVIINKPVNGFINLHINAGIVQSSDTCQHNGRTVSLCCAACQKAIDILEENLHRDFFVGIITGKIHTHQRYKLNLRMQSQKLTQSAFVLFFRFNYIQ